MVWNTRFTRVFKLACEAAGAQTHGESPSRVLGLRPALGLWGCVGEQVKEGDTLQDPKKGLPTRCSICPSVPWPHPHEAVCQSRLPSVLK